MTIRTCNTEVLESAAVSLDSRDEGQCEQQRAPAGRGGSLQRAVAGKRELSTAQAVLIIGLLSLLAGLLTYWLRSSGAA